MKLRTFLLAVLLSTNLFATQWMSSYEDAQKMAVATNKLILEKSLDHIFKSIDFCYNIGSKLYTFHPGFIADPEKPNHYNKP